MRRVKILLLISITFIQMLTPTITVYATESRDLQETIIEVLAEDSETYTKEERVYAKEVVKGLRLKEVGKLHTKLVGREDLTKNEDLILQAVKTRISEIGLYVITLVLSVTVVLTWVWNKYIQK